MNKKVHLFQEGIDKLKTITSRMNDQHKNFKFY